MLTWRYFANDSRMPAVTLIAIRALHKDARIGQTEEILFKVDFQTFQQIFCI